MMVRWLRIASFVYCAMVAWLLLSPNPLGWLGYEMPQLLGADRAGHFLLFAGLAGLLWASHWPLRWQWVLASLLLYAIATELCQAFVPKRALDGGDLAANLAGVVAGTFCWWMVTLVAASARTRAVACSAGKATEMPG